jgi:hypothetical protein
LALIICSLKSSPAAFLGIVEESAFAAAVDEHRIRPTDQKRLIAQPR